MFVKTSSYTLAFTTCRIGWSRTANNSVWSPAQLGNSTRCFSAKLVRRGNAFEPQQRLMHSNTFIKSAHKGPAAASASGQAFHDQSSSQSQLKSHRSMGTGSITYSDGTTVRGEFRNSALYEGAAVQVRPSSGARQEERWIRGKRSGDKQITFDDADGAELDKRLQEGKLVGQGTLKDPGGDVYEGHFLGTVRHGQGLLTYADGRTLQGEWREGTFCTGAGLIKQADGTYDGEIRNGRWHGQGTHTKKDGSVRQGEFQKGVFRSGTATQKLPGGVIFSGEFKDFRRNGKGTLSHGDGRSLEGEFKDGKFLNGTGALKCANGDIYDGQWQDGLWHGEGKLTYGATGENWQGRFELGKVHTGSGTVLLHDGLKRVGEWKNGRFTGVVMEY